MRVRSFAAAAVGALALGMLAQAPAQAMTDIATIDEADEYSAVVALVIVTPPLVKDDPDSRLATLYCSGVLINDVTVLTASHCNVITSESWFINGNYTLGVTNANDLEVPEGGFWFTWNDHERQADVQLTNVRTNDLYKGGYRDDVSIQVMDRSLAGVSEEQMPKIPPLGLLDQLQKAKTLKDSPVTVLGYGSAQKTIPASTGPTFPSTNERRYADLATIALDKQWIHQDQNLGKDPLQGGACYGDSGGPSLLEHLGTTYVVGVTSTGDGPCFATNVASRVDNESAHALIGSVNDLLLPRP